MSFFHPQLDSRVLKRATEDWMGKVHISILPQIIHKEKFVINVWQWKARENCTNQREKRTKLEGNWVSESFFFSFAWKFFTLNDRIFLSIVAKYAFHHQKRKIIFHAEAYYVLSLIHSFTNIFHVTPAPLHHSKPIRWKIHYQERRVACAHRCREPSPNVVENEIIMLAGNRDCEASSDFWVIRRILIYNGLHFGGLVKVV